MNVTIGIAGCFAIVIVGCASPLQVDTASFKAPTSYANHQVIEGLEIAIVPIDDKAASKETFGTDMRSAQVLPIQLIVRNAGTREFEINHTQIYGIGAGDQYTVAYTLGRAAERVRGSSIGTTAVAGATAGAVASAAAGAALGAAIGGAGGDAGTGAAVGAAIGATTGTAAGLAEGLSDRFTMEFKRQLATLAFEDRVVFPGDIQQGFIYLKWQPYQSLRIKLFDISANLIHELQFPIQLSR